MAGLSAKALGLAAEEIETRIASRAERYLAESRLVVELPEHTRESFARKSAMLDLIIDHLAVERLAGHSRAEEVKAVPALVTAHRRSMAILGLAVGKVSDTDGDL
jgi:hypothetical protein